MKSTSGSNPETCLNQSCFLFFFRWSIQPATWWSTVSWAPNFEQSVSKLPQLWQTSSNSQKDFRETDILSRHLINEHLAQAFHLRTLCLDICSTDNLSQGWLIFFTSGPKSSATYLGGQKTYNKNQQMTSEHTI